LKALQLKCHWQNRKLIGRNQLHVRVDSVPVNGVHEEDRMDAVVPMAVVDAMIHMMTIIHHHRRRGDVVHAVWHRLLGHTWVLADRRDLQLHMVNFSFCESL
jgi:hypothetical protein